MAARICSLALQKDESRIGRRFIPSCKTVGEKRQVEVGASKSGPCEGDVTYLKRTLNIFLSSNVVAKTTLLGILKSGAISRISEPMVLCSACLPYDEIRPDPQHAYMI